MNSETRTIDQAVKLTTDKAGKYLTFSLDQEEYGIGIVVDAVSEVINIGEQDIEDTPEFGISMNTSYILGMAKMDGGIKILLDIDRILSQEEVIQLEKVS